MIKNTIITLFAVIFLEATLPVSGADTPKKMTLSNVYGNHMVLQRQMPIRIEGATEPGQTVSVTLNGKNAKSVANASGNFTVVLPAMEAGGPYSLTLENNSGERLSLEDVLIGEVWFCSGQSNMSMPVYQCEPFCQMSGAEYVKAIPEDPGLRLFQVERAVSPGRPKKELNPKSKWRTMNANNARSFSGYAYFFGKELREKLNVPVGLINSSWGGTAIQPWIPDAEFYAAGRENDIKLLEIGRDYSDALAAGREAKSVKALREWVEKYYNYNPEATQNSKAWAKQDFDDSDWEKVIKLREPGIGWFRNTIDIPEAWVGKDLALFLYVVVQRDEVYFNGEKIGSFSLENPSAVSSYKVPGRLVKARENVIAVRVSWFVGPWGGLWSGDKLFIRCPELRKIPPMIIPSTTWRMKQEFVIPRDVPTPQPMGKGALEGPGIPGTLFNGMVNAWTDVPIRGVLWYQGRSNVRDPEDYFHLHKRWISAWRKAWNDPDMPMIMTQLAGCLQDRPTNPFPKDQWKKIKPGQPSGAAAICEVQEHLLSFPNMGCVVANDMGEQSNLHPKRKKELGYRAAMEAMRLAYGYQGVTAGPRFKSMMKENGTLRLLFDNIGGGLTTSDGNGPTSFAIAGANGVFYWADARFDGNAIVLSAEQVSNPVHVRYAWSDFAGDANFINKDGFPAFPFRTDLPNYLKNKK